MDLLLHTFGGNTDVAEKLMGMLRGHVGAAELRVIVPDFAKSAGTLMTLGADRVVMSDMSELGPIDPQILLGEKLQPVQNFLDAYREHADALRRDPENIAAQIMLGKLDPAILKLCAAAVEAAVDLLDAVEDGEEDEHRDEDGGEGELRRQPDAEPDDEERGEDDAGDGVEEDHHGLEQFGQPQEQGHREPEHDAGWRGRRWPRSRWRGGAARARRRRGRASPRRRLTGPGPARPTSTTSSRKTVSRAGVGARITTLRAERTAQVAGALRFALDM